MKRIVALLFMLLSLGLAIEPEVFSEYTIKLNFEKTDQIHVVHEFELENQLGVSIIPGIGTLDLVFDKTGEFELNDLKAYDKDGVPVKAKFLDSGVQYEIWTPLGPRGKYKIFIEYTLKGPVASGILFKEIRYPILDTSLPVRRGKIAVKAPEGYAITYAEGADTVERGSAEWIFSETPVVADLEFSPLPLPRTSIRMVYIFWGVILTALIVLNVVITKRQRDKKRGKNKKKKGRK